MNERTVPVVLQWGDAGVEKFKKIPANSEQLQVFRYFKSSKPPPVKVRILDPATSKFLSIGNEESFTFQPAIDSPVKVLVVPSK